MEEYNKEAAIALVKSIFIWLDRSINNPLNPYPNSVNCPLCNLFIQNECKKCPIVLANTEHHNHCLNTPYQVVSTLIQNNPDLSKLRNASKKETLFLIKTLKSYLVKTKIPTYKIRQVYILLANIVYLEKRIKGFWNCVYTKSCKYCYLSSYFCEIMCERLKTKELVSFYKTQLLTLMENLCI